MENVRKIAGSMTPEEAEKMHNLVLDLDWEIDRMSESGVETYEELLKLIYQVHGRTLELNND